MVRSARLFLGCSLWVAASAQAAPLELPKRTPTPEAGHQTSITAPEYAGSDVHHLLYLPPDWRPDWRERGLSWPVIVEYTGNRYPAAGSTGTVEGAALGYGISGGRYIWIVLPYISADHKSNAPTWWGDVEATVEYAKTNVPRACLEFGGNREQVFLCGFSRGAIGVNFLGLHDDEIAQLWCGLISHDHYDGVREWKGTTWGSPLDQYRERAGERLKRLGKRPALISQAGSTRDIRDYLEGHFDPATVTFVDVQMQRIFPEFPNDWAIHPHNDRWLLHDSPERTVIWTWVESVLDSGVESR